MIPVRALRGFAFAASSFGRSQLLSSSGVYFRFSALLPTLSCGQQTDEFHCVAMDKFIRKTPRQKTEDSPSKGSPSSSSSRVTRSGMAPVEVQEEIEKYSQMPEKEKRRHYKCGAGYLTLQKMETWPEYAAKLPPKKLGNAKSKASKLSTVYKMKLLSVSSPVLGDNSKADGYEVNDQLNRKVSLFRGDITALEIDAIVNAANNTLLGGGGVDGAIHAAAGPFLKRECATLKGCETGDAKLSHGFKLPAKYVIHTVGPIGEGSAALQSCYERCLQLLKDHKLKSIAFPCISTGIYGYPPEKAAHMALSTIRHWLETDGYAREVNRIIFCVFMKTDVAIYEDLLPMYFPLASNVGGSKAGKSGGDEETTSETVKSKGSDLSAEAKSMSDTTNNAASEVSASDEKTTGADGKDGEGKENERDEWIDTTDTKQESGEHPPPTKRLTQTKL